MPPKRNPASIAPPDDRTDPSPSVDQPILEEYNDLVPTHRETLRRIQELEATQAEQVGSSYTSTSPHELCDPKGPISQQEKSRHIAEGLCLYCGKSGHMRFNCPKKSKTESIAVVGRYQAPPPAFEESPSNSENSKSQATAR